MTTPDQVAVVLLAAGSGSRLGAGVPKALVPLAGRPLAAWSAAALAPLADVLVLVVPGGPEGEAIAAAVREVVPDACVVPGGARRRDSVLIGVLAAAGARHVLVHDAARALVTTGLARRVLDGARAHGAALPAVAVPDTLVRADGGGPFAGDEVPRAGVHAVQTPQGFDRELLLRAHRAADPEWDAPDDGTMVRRLGERVALVEGEADNIKVTWPRDLERAGTLLAGRRERGDAMNLARTGIGWDVHPLVTGRPTVLAGVTLDPELGPRGHSDGDPLAHALCDALLGAAALGDIGSHFPDTDERWKGAAGCELLARTVGVLAEHGWRPAHVDAVVVTDRPKIAPHREAVREQLARVLGLPVAAVSVKGKRTEGLGSLAGGAGIACHAVATIAALAARGGVPPGTPGPPEPLPGPTPPEPIPPGPTPLPNPPEPRPDPPPSPYPEIPPLDIKTE